MIMKRLLLAAGLCLLSAPAWAACAVTNLQVKDNAAVTANVPYADDGSGANNCAPQVQLKQGGHVAGVTAGSALQVDGSATTQPVSQATAANLNATVVQGTAANLNATVVGTGTFSAQISQQTGWAGGTLGAMANYGTSPGAVLVPGMNAFITNTPAVSQSGTWNINNITGTVSLPTGAATAVGQGSTTSGQSGSLMQGAVTTGSPTYTTAQTSPLSLDTAGNLRVNVVAGGAGGGAVTAAANSYSDGALVTEGTKADTPCATPTSSTACSLIALAKAIANGVTSSVPLGTSGGWTYKLLSGTTNSGVSVKASPGQLGMLHCYNPNASVAYIQLYDTAGAVTVGTNVKLSFGVPATNSTGFSLPVNGIQFTSGIAVAATTTAGGSTAPGTALDCNAAFN